MAPKIPCVLHKGWVTVSHAKGHLGKREGTAARVSGRACFLSWGLKDRRTSKEVNAEDMSGEDFVIKVGGRDE